MKVIKVNLPKSYVMVLWSLMVAYTQKDLIEKETSDAFFRIISKLAKGYDSAEKRKSIDFLFSFADAETVWNTVNQAILSGKNDGILTDAKQVLMLSEILTAFAIELDGAVNE